MVLPVLVTLVILGNLFELLSVYLHVGSHYSHCDSVNSCVPVLIGAPICIYQASYNNWVSFLEVGAHQLLNDFVVQEQKSTLSSLVVHILSCLNQPLKKLWPEKHEVLLCFSSDRLKNFLTFIYVDHFFGWTSYWPVLKQSIYQIDPERFVFFEEVLHTCQQLVVESLEPTNFVKWNQNFLGENPMLLFEGNCVAINDRAEDLQ